MISKRDSLKAISFLFSIVRVLRLGVRMFVERMKEILSQIGDQDLTARILMSENHEKENVM
ncbi:hypothetical protein PM10SUCC1_19270 [Propionigenium maris DSM 9537]|uniref:Uncharacterized protein n=1 Tax=Propionigenium maris DSM 9537 TaxID=1123000 RepID=A0A9W6GL78_9FUSO|nr:hypothetical protein PM10SUCC1_19270 [Propionigenium maris DSM 9537]